jgi:hypothetical protein
VGALNKVGNERKTKSWHDVWLEGVPLRISYQELFQITRDPKAMVADLMVDGEWRIQFRRELDGNQVVKLGELVEKLQRVNLSAEEDMVRWAFEKNGCFSTSSLYIFFSSGRVHSRRIEEIWDTTLPLKIRFFFFGRWSMISCNWLSS